MPVSSFTIENLLRPTDETESCRRREFRSPISHPGPAYRPSLKDAEDAKNFLWDYIQNKSHQTTFVSPIADSRLTNRQAPPPMSMTSSSSPLTGTTGLNQPSSKSKPKSPYIFRPRRLRTVYTDVQLSVLEDRFVQQKYLSTPDRVKLAKHLSLTQLQVKTWYQNRRMRWKKSLLSTGDCTAQQMSSLLRKNKGRPKKEQQPNTDKATDGCV